MNDPIPLFNPTLSSFDAVRACIDHAAEDDAIHAVRTPASRAIDPIERQLAIEIHDAISRRVDR